MAKISYLLIPPEFDLSYKKALGSGDRFVASRVRRNNVYRTRRRIKGLTQKSLLPECKNAWNALTTEEKSNWALAGAECNLSGYRLFVKDKTLRIKNNLSGNSTPSTLMQAMVGTLALEGDATSMKITQTHPFEYWVKRKVTGTKSQFEPVLVRESVGLPIQIKISYISALWPAGANPSAKYYAHVYSLYQGRDIENVLEINLDLDSTGETLTATLGNLLGEVKSYVLYLEIIDCQGVLIVDNIQLIHSGQNWVRDPFCNDLDQSFTRAFYQVPKHWAPVVLPEGAFFGSEFKSLLLSDSFLIDSFPISNSNHLESYQTLYLAGQSFLCSSNAVLDHCSFLISRVGVHSGYLTAKLYAHSGTFGVNGVPTGSPLATSDQIATASLSTSLSLIDFNFSGVNRIDLLADTPYFIVIDFNADVTGDDIWLDVGSFVGSDIDDGNMADKFSSAPWSARSGIEMIFYVYGSII